MFNKEDFELPLEAELRLRVIKDEIDNANDVTALKEHLKETSRLVMFYQHLLGKVAKDILAKDMVDWVKENSGNPPKNNG